MRGTGRGRVCLQRLEVAHAASGVCPPSRRYVAQERDLNLRRYRSSLFACRTPLAIRSPLRSVPCRPPGFAPSSQPRSCRSRLSSPRGGPWRDETDDASHRVVGHPDLLVWVSEDRWHLRGLTGTPIAPQPLKQLSRSAWRRGGAPTASSSDSRNSRNAVMAIGSHTPGFAEQRASAPDADAPTQRGNRAGAPHQRLRRRWIRARTGC
jgi:hypothetical protein